MKSFSDDEIEAIFLIAESVTGTKQQGRFRKSIIPINVRSRLMETQSKSLVSYLKLALSDPREYEEMVSAMTIHTTSWFRERPHFFWMEDHYEKGMAWNDKKTISIWCSACSTGEEVYSLALTFEAMRRKTGGRIDYKVLGTDIDPVSVGKAKKAIYKKAALQQIPEEYRKFCMVGQGSSSSFFTLSKEVRERCRFRTADLSKAIPLNEKFDMVICRNVLIYFDEKGQRQVVNKLLNQVSTDGHLVLGLSESMDLSDVPGLKREGHSIYHKGRVEEKTDEKSSLPRVLVVDDSPTVCRTLSKVLSKEFEVEFAQTSAEADEKLTSFRPGAVTLDLNLGQENGEDWLVKIRQRGLKIPVILVSGAAESDAERVFKALDSGAQSFFSKNDISKDNTGLFERLNHFLRPKTPTRTTLSDKPAGLDKKLDFTPSLICIGSSTGGTIALKDLLTGIGPLGCPVVIVQHIPPEFVKTFGESLAQASGMSYNTEFPIGSLEPNTIYMSQSNEHIHVKKDGEGWRAKISGSHKVNGHVPAVNELFESVARADCSKVVSIILTGMGDDGAQGQLKIKNRGGYTMAQDEKSSVVYGMPKQAVEQGAVLFCGNLHEIRAQILRHAAASKSAA